jgi:hypothetical protein
VESDALSVQVTTAASVQNAQAAAVTRVAMRLGNTVYLFDTNGLKLVSGDAAGITGTTKPVTADVPGSAKLTVRDGSLISVAHNAKAVGGWASNIVISLPPSASGQVRGLCGNYDGDKANDNLAPNGQAMQNMTQLATAWTPPAGQDLLAGVTPAVAGNLPVINAAPATAEAPAAAPAATPAAPDQPRVCQLAGLGHMTSFDNKQFDITRNFGTFSLVESDALSVQVSTAPSIQNQQAAAVARVAVRLGNSVYLFDTNGLKQVSGDGAGINVTAKPASAGVQGSAKLTMSDGSEIRIAHGAQTSDRAWASDMQITLPPSAGGKVRGLCGNFDGDKANDFVTPSGQAVQDVNTLATAWTPPPGQDLLAGAQPAPAAAAPAPAGDQFGTVKAVQVTSQPAQHPAAQACLPQGYRLLGGGARVATAAGQNFLTASYPEGQCWNGVAKDHINPSIATLDVYAIGIYDPDSLIPISTLSMTSEVAPHPAVISPILPPPFVVTGGGAKVTYGGAGNILIASYPNDGNPKNTWVAASKDHDVSDPATVTAYVIGMLPQTESGVKFDIVQVIANSPSPAAGAEATAVLPEGYSVIGGGALALGTTGAGSLLTDSFPTANGWTGRSHDLNTSDPARIAVFAIGIRKLQ